VWLPLFGLLVGALIGLKLSLKIPSAYTYYYVAFLVVMLDTTINGLKCAIRNSFDSTFFWSGFLVNVIFALMLVYLGERLRVDLYLVVFFAFGYRMLNNISAIQALLLQRYKSNALEKREK